MLGAYYIITCQKYILLFCFLYYYIGNRYVMLKQHERVKGSIYVYVYTHRIIHQYTKLSSHFDN